MFLMVSNLIIILPALTVSSPILNFFPYVLTSEPFNDIMLLHNNALIRFVLHICWNFQHTYVHSKGSTSMFHFIDQMSYIITINFLFSQSYLHYYLFLCLYFNLIGNFES